jgi:hypothetical protein
MQEHAAGPEARDAARGGQLDARGLRGGGSHAPHLLPSHQLPGPISRNMQNKKVSDAFHQILPSTPYFQMLGKLHI